MKLRTFSDVNMKDAVRQVRAALGETALILSERVTVNGVEVVAATDVPDPEAVVSDAIRNERLCGHAGTEPPSADMDLKTSDFNTPTDVSDYTAPTTLKESLLWHRIPEILVEDLTTATLSVSISKLVRFGSFSFSPGKSPLALVGPPGSGKTLSVAKLATRLVLAGNTPLVITTDRECGGGIDQLAIHTRRLGIPLLAAHDIKTLKRALNQRRNGQPVLIDTASVNPYSADTHAVLTELTSSTRAQLCLTVPAGHDTEESADIAEIFGKARTRMMIATRMDQARRIGNVVTAAACGLVLTEAGISDATVGGLVRLTPRILASRLAKRGDPPVADDAPSEQALSATDQGQSFESDLPTQQIKNRANLTHRHPVASLVQRATHPAALSAM
ncbi:flagellar biosynthesis protein FlhF [Acetobacter oeni]|uniref:GTP-binding protein n=1 Tax=Acetobacter oeni TaxID=304077 RepID=A0A511XFU6_9PROT|nr:hypothetical protein [Acetobacter oeni]MBB3882255.1 flagellar biosynthesis protein FlhF [Acetobacter oeni]NHO18008.1 hypothetical protein [Acetobacter oeni]GBR01195.1 flagellar biosynthesis protein [Acetobacter oeni LMG 21952]GEN61826.1 GTP-binding protein [Acetobacter oeni]